jgi:hypothetical protein
VVRQSVHEKVLSALGLASRVSLTGQGPDAVARAIRARGAVELETAIIERGGASAALRSTAQWEASDPRLRQASLALIPDRHLYAPCKRSVSRR